eukprot:SAG31_NODE_4_length_45662_cov_15.654622_25_plen_291_part_00
MQVLHKDGLPRDTPTFRHDMKQKYLNACDFEAKANKVAGEVEAYIGSLSGFSALATTLETVLPATAPAEAARFAPCPTPRAHAPWSAAMRILLSPHRMSAAARRRGHQPHQLCCTGFTHSCGSLPTVGLRRGSAVDFVGLLRQITSMIESLGTQLECSVATPIREYVDTEVQRAKIRYEGFLTMEKKVEKQTHEYLSMKKEVGIEFLATAERALGARQHQLLSSDANNSSLQSSLYQSASTALLAAPSSAREHEVRAGAGAFRRADGLGRYRAANEKFLVILAPPTPFFR